MAMQPSTLGRRLEEMRSGMAVRASEGTPAPKPKYGDDIFSTAGGPRKWSQYIGQRRAVGQLRAVIASAKFRDAPLPHILIASGVPGVGKSALARIIAAEAGVGLTEMQGKINQDEAKALLSQMKDNDILFLDEIHQLVVGGKHNSEWLLSLLQDGVLLSAAGEWQAPKVTVIGASTNAAELPEAVLSRFSVRPVITAYSDEDAATIAQGMAVGIFEEIGLDTPSEQTCAAIVQAANNMPRQIKALLTSLRDAEIADLAQRDDDGHSDLTEVLDWNNLTSDGLDDLAQRLLATLLVTFGGRTGKDNLASVLGEQVYPHMTERILMTKGLMAIDKGGRFLTELGVQRTLELELTE